MSRKGVASGLLTNLEVEFRKWNDEDQLDREVSAPQGPEGRRYYRVFETDRSGDASASAWYRLEVTDPDAILAMGYKRV